jgi:radical SAM protein (TIGR01212 family)
MKSNPFPCSDDNKRYHTLAYHNRRTFGGRIYKAVLDGGFTCPNLDGIKGTTGCLFCDGGSGAFTQKLSVTQQLTLEMQRIRRKVPDARAIAYFQVHTNTYAPVSRLRELYEEALQFPDIIGLSVGTRPDCLPQDVLDYLGDLNRRTYLTVDLGVQTVHDRTAAQFRRGYDFGTFLRGYHALQERGIRTCLHIINGLPDENADAMLETAQVLGQLRPQAVKLQLLHILEGTPYADLWRNGKIPVLSQEAYTDIVVRQLEYFPPETVIERVTGDGEKAKLLAPLWSMDKIRTLGSIDKLQAQRDSFQGCRFADR